MDRPSFRDRLRAAELRVVSARGSEVACPRRGATELSHCLGCERLRRVILEPAGEVTQLECRLGEPQTGGEPTPELARDLELLLEVSFTLSRSLELEATFRAAAELLSAHVAHVCTFDVLDADGRLRPLASAGSQDPPLGVELPLCRSLDAVGGRTLVEHSGDRSSVWVPLRSGELTTGLMTWHLIGGGRFSRADVALAEEVARTAACHLANASTFSQARQASRARDEVLRMVAHDLRNPLNTIQLGAGVLLRTATEGPPQVAQRVGSSIQQACRRVSRLTDDLLDEAQLDAGTLRLAPVRADPRDLLADAAVNAEVLASEADIKVEIDLPPWSPRVLADPARVQQVFSNLVGNAVKFTGPGGRIGLGAQARDGVVCFRVSDSGPGIAPEHLPHVFDRFWQGHARDRRGVGLGLAIAQGIVERHGGRIWVESVLTKGSTFCFTLPTVPDVAGV